MSTVPQVTASEFDKTLGERHPLRILVAEDNRVNQRVVQFMLKRFGYSADIVANGKLALARVQQQAYDVILMDIHMPEMGGEQATLAISDWFADVGKRRPRIIALTANDFKNERDRYLANGMDDCLSKPIMVDLLMAALECCERLDAPQDAALFDRNVLEAQFGEDADMMLAELLPLFLESSERSVAQLEVAVANENSAEITAYAHGLKGAGLSIGAMQFSAACGQMEQRGRQSELDGIAALMREISAEFNKIKSASARP